MLTTALIGGAFSFISSLANKGVDCYEKKQEAAVAKERRSDEIELAKILAEKDTAIEAMKAATASQVASYNQDVAMGKPSQWVINIKQLVRPVVTYSTLLFIPILWFTIPVEDVALRASLVFTADQLSGLTIGWWFGGRAFKAVNG